MELFDQRKTELEVAAKNTIVEIYLIREKRDDIVKVLEMKERYLNDLNSSLRELEYLDVKIKEKEVGSKPE